MRLFEKFALDFLYAALSVLSFVALAVWVISQLESHHGLLAKQSLDGKLVVFLALLWLTTLVWGIRRGGADGKHHPVNLPPLSKGSEETIESEITEDGKSRIKRRA